VEGCFSTILKNGPTNIYDFDFWNGKNQKRISSKMNTFARSKDPDPIGSGLEKL
jgi:hypothetical protein